MNEIFKQINQYAAQNNIPIIEREGLEIVINIMNQNKVTSILEIGTAIGYSAAKFHHHTNATVTTIERERDLYELAKQNINLLKYDHAINLICADALLLNDKELPLFDCLYIDGAKSQYLKFLNKYICHLKPGGVVIFDNLLFHGFVFSSAVEQKSRNLKQLVRKLENFINEMENSQDYNFQLIEKGDGIGVLYRKGENNEQ